MAIIGKEFPQTRKSRKEKLQYIIKDEKRVSTVKVPGHGLKDVYKIPLEYLSYNPYNTRFLAQAKTLETKIGRDLSDENPDDIKEIEKFIWKYKEKTNENTIKSLIKEGQLQPGVVTIEGVILSGNRRFRLLNEIQRNYSKYSKEGVNLTGLGYFEAAIIEEKLTKKDIRKYESYYQYGNEDKVEYDPIQKYLAADQQIKLGFSEKEIAENFLTLTDGKEKKVQEWLEIYSYMEEYLEYIDESGIYTALEEREEAFINLYKTKKGLEKGTLGKNIWDFQTIDINNLKLRYYDYIWASKSTHEFRLFKNIFSDKSLWNNFNSKVKKCVDKVKIDSLDEYRKKNPTENEENLSKVREHDYRDQCEKELNSIFGGANAIIVSKEEEDTPAKIANQIEVKLDKLKELIDNSSQNEIINSEEFVDRIRDINKKIGKIKQRID